MVYGIQIELRRTNTFYYTAITAGGVVILFLRPDR